MSNWQSQLNNIEPKLCDLSLYEHVEKLFKSKEKGAV